MEKENAGLQKLVAEKELTIDILNEVVRGKLRARNPVGVRYLPVQEKFGASE